MNNSQRKYTLTQAIEKIKWYCARQERSHKQVSEKLKQWGLYWDQVEAIVAELIMENYLSEERFAEAIVNGKHNIKGWGRVKIRQWLYLEGVSEYSINKAIAELDEESYLQRCAKEAKKKRGNIQAESEFERQGKLKRYLYGKGYESEIIQAAIQQLESDENAENEEH